MRAMYGDQWHVENRKEVFPSSPEPFMESEGPLRCSKESVTGSLLVPAESSPHPISLIPILILPSCLRHDQPRGLFLPGRPTKFCTSFLYHQTGYMSCPSRPPWLNNIWSQSQWPRGLQRLRSWTVRTLRSLVRIPLEAWKYIWVFLCCAVLCRQRSWWWPGPRPMSPTEMSIRIHNYRS